MNLLSDRATKVMQNGAISDRQLATNTVPVCSILGPVLLEILSVIRMQELKLSLTFNLNLPVLLNQEMLLPAWRDRKVWRSSSWSSRKVNARLCTWSAIIWDTGTGWGLMVWRAAQQKGIWGCWSTKGTAWIIIVPWQPWHSQPDKIGDSSVTVSVVAASPWILCAVLACTV